MRRILFAIFFLGAALAQAEEPTVVSWVGIQGGVDEQHAVSLPTGRTLRLNHFQFKNLYDYFWLDLKAGQSVTLTLAVGTQGILVRPDNTFVETDQPYAGIQLKDAQGRPIGDLEIVREKGIQKSIEVDVSRPQKIYVLVGSPYEGTHKDQFVFRADVSNFFDGGSDRDAGSTMETAVPLVWGRADYDNFLTKNDDADYFSLQVSPGQKIKIQIVPENARTHLIASLYNEVAQELARARSSKPGAGVVLETEAKSSKIYLRIYRDVGDEPTKYGIFFPDALPPVAITPVRPQLNYPPAFLRLHP